MSKIDPHVLKMPVAGRNLDPGSFGAQISEEKTLLVFVRHFG